MIENNNQAEIPATPAPVSLPTPVINSEADIIQWLRARAEKTGIKGLVLKVDSGDGTLYPCVAKILGDSDAFGCGHTIEEALAMLMPSIKAPHQLAEQKRAVAATLLAEAEALAPIEMPAPVAAAQEVAA